jgi:hypothetical protein
MNDLHLCYTFVHISLDHLIYLHMEVRVKVDLRIIEIAVCFGGRLKMFS